MRCVEWGARVFVLATMALLLAGGALADAELDPERLGECEEDPSARVAASGAAGCPLPRLLPQRIAALAPEDRSHRTDPFGRFALGLPRDLTRSSSVSRLDELTRLAVQGKKPRFLRWMRDSGGDAGRLESRVPGGFERFGWMTAPLSRDARLFPAYTPDPERWAATQESTLAASGDCICPGGDPPTGGGGGGTASAGRVPDGVITMGTLLTVRKNIAAPGNLNLDWGASCAATANNYAVYEGALGSYYSHTRNKCTTGGQTSTTITPAAGSRYFLTVPLSPDTEGEYGAASDGSGRPVAPNPCRSARKTSCP